MTRQELYARKEKKLKQIKYKYCFYDDYNYKILKNICYKTKFSVHNNTYNDCIMMIDTETSKSKHNKTYVDSKGRLKYEPVDNYVVAWTLSIRAVSHNICTLYGRTPTELVECLNRILDIFQGEETYIYVHNLSYDWWFIRKFLFQAWHLPTYQLNTKSHYPVLIEFENGVKLKDSLILAQRSLDKWALDLNVEHKKAVGYWDYDLIRNQDTPLTSEELTYIECDTLAGVECIDATCQTLKCNISTIPLTSTGIIRRDIIRLAKKNKQRDLFLRLVPSFDQQDTLECIYHGGYTHAHFDVIGWLMENVEAYDFASSYPFVMLSEKYPMEKFTPCPDADVDYITGKADEYAFIFKLQCFDIEFDDKFVMPTLQTSKCFKIVDGVQDSGRLLSASYCEIYLNEIDLKIIKEHYHLTPTNSIVSECEFAYKDYLPRWLTDYIFERFKAKTELKGVEGKERLYNIEKTKINGVYGCHVQKPLQPEIKEDYEFGDFYNEKKPLEELKEDYEKYVNSRNHVLPYQWGVWVTSYAFYNLFQLGKCCKEWIYSDTDSCYGSGWDEKKLKVYNDNCIAKLEANGYGGVEHNGKVYYLGVAELDGKYDKFITLGAKKYATSKDGKVKITVAGVPKKTGAKCLKDDILNFKHGLIFDGKTTGKLTHMYISKEDIYIDENGNECGDSVDLFPCDYLLSETILEDVDFDYINTEEITITEVE